MLEKYRIFAILYISMMKKIYRLLFPEKLPHQVRADYNIPPEIKLSVDMTPDGYFIVSSPELPGMLTQARTGKELLEMVNDAILSYYDVPKRDADIIFNTIHINGRGTLSLRTEQTELQAA